MTKLFIVRQCEAKGNEKRLFQGEINCDITKLGAKQLEFLTERFKDEKIDEVLLSVMRAPHTYTGENVIEINCHGGILVTKRILSLILENGARLAEPGEFTKRAYLNGRIDLSQAEAVMDLIGSKSEAARKQALNGLSGSFKDKISDLKNRMLKDAAFIEAALDDPEHISFDGFKEIFSTNVEQYTDELDRLIRTATKGRLIREGIKTVILGKPNVGKSSLLNALLGEERAIVTEIAGTTRDTLEESVRIGDIFLNIVDTAGVHETDDRIEMLGLERTKKSAETAELVLFVIDAAQKLTQDDKDIIALIKEVPYIVIKNKTDLEEKTSDKDIIELTGKSPVHISAKYEQGLEELNKAITEIFFKEKLAVDAEVTVFRERHRQALIDALDAMFHVKQSLEMDMSEDFITIDLLGACKSLGEILGENADEDLIDTIFREFCMGK